MTDLAMKRPRRLAEAGRFVRKLATRRVDRFQLGLFALLVVLGLIMIMPIIYIVSHALKPYQELFLYPPRLFAQDPTLQNFAELFGVANTSVVPMTRLLFNSVFTTAAIVATVTIVSALCAYPLSKHRFPGSRLLFAAILLTLMFAPETVGIPRYLIVSHLGIMNTYLGHILPFAAAPTCVFLMKQFVDQVPGELLEAAKMDGGNEWVLFRVVIIPMIMPAVATVAILTFQTAWVNVETSRLFMQDESMKTFPFFLTTLTNGLANSVARQGAAAAAAVILFLPNLIVFLVFQRKVIATMAHSGIK